MRRIKDVEELREAAEKLGLTITGPMTPSGWIPIQDKDGKIGVITQEFLEDVPLLERFKRRFRR